jgi:hypothetical protein
MNPPRYQVRGGESYLLNDPVENTFHFVYIEPTDSLWVPARWMIDRWTPNAIRNGSARFYRLVDPPPWYRAHTFATVNDAGVLVQYNVTENNELMDAIRNQGETGISYLTARPSSSPPDDDRRFREDRDGIHIAPGPPPHPPGGGPVAAEGAESRPPQREEAPRAVAALAALAVAAEPLAQPTVLAPPEREATSALRLLADLLLLNREENTIYDDLNSNWRRWGARGPYGAGGYGVYRPPPIEIPRLNIINNIFNDDISPIYPRAAPAAAKPQKRVADLVIADAVKSEACCPITMDPIKAETAACVAPCYHVFEKEAIQGWLADHTTCPQCREACSL